MLQIENIFSVSKKARQLYFNAVITFSVVQREDKPITQGTAYFWGKPHNYDLCVNSFAIDLDSTAKFLSSSIFEMECIKNGK